MTAAKRDEPVVTDLEKEDDFEDDPQEDWQDNGPDDWQEDPEDEDEDMNQTPDGDTGAEKPDSATEPAAKDAKAGEEDPASFWMCDQTLRAPLLYRTHVECWLFQSFQPAMSLARNTQSRS